MKKIFLFFIIIVFISNCAFKKVVKKHGVRNLEKKQLKLDINVSNINDIKEILGPPSIKSHFDENLWFYIEREMSTEPLLKLGKEKLITNNVLIIEIDPKGLLSEKEFYDLKKMNDLDFAKIKTEQKFTNKSFVYDFLSSLRQKINDPLGKRKKP